MSGEPLSEEDIANLSDEEVMGMAFSPAPKTKEPETTPTENSENVEPAEEPGSEVLATDDAEETESDSNDEEEVVEEEEPTPTTPGSTNEGGPSKADPAKADAAPVEKTGDPATSEEKVEVKEEAPEPDYKAAYNQIMGGFKANGKEIKLQSIDEAVQLMQMGANYTKKLQALQPNLKLLKMLENNQLLDEGKLSYLIDISKKDPAAIKKLVRDSGIDPMDIDTTVDPGYQPGNHQVSDESFRFTSTLEEVAEDPEGKEMIVQIHKTWDEPSKEALWSDPDILRVLTAQKKNGIYAKISSEVERRQTLGHLRNTPFLKAYQQVGEEMHNQGLLVIAQPAAASPQPSTPAQSQPVATRRPTAKPVANNDRAKAASPTKTTTPKPGVADFNPLALSDEDFEKNAALAQRL